MTTQRYRLTCEYLGTPFSGFQIQPHQRTIQGELRTSLKKLFGVDLSVTGSGRTDTGVHAAGQVCHFDAPDRFDTQTIEKALNAHLPPEISVRDIRMVNSDFHARFSALAKTYRYTILNRSARSALACHRCWHIPRKLDTARMVKGSRYLIGNKDFKSFQSSDPRRDPEKEDRTIRTVFDLEIDHTHPWIEISITANGFLYKMVRNIVGTLVEVGLEQLDPLQIPEILQARSRIHAGETAKPWGLCLMNVFYNENDIPGFGKSAKA